MTDDADESDLLERTLTTNPVRCPDCGASLIDGACPECDIDAEADDGE